MAELIEIPAGDGTAEAYLARPDGTPKGGVLFFMDAIGLRPRIAEMADEIAAWGYLVLAPHVFYREGSAAELSPTGDLRDPEQRESFFATSNVGQHIANLTPDLAARDTAAYVEKLQALLTEAGAAGAKLAATGYCMGARLAIRAAGQFPGLVVAVGGFHGGGLVTDDPQSPHTVVTGQAEYVFGHAENDRSLSPENAVDLDKALEAAGATYTSAIYPDAPHGYTMSDTSSWHEPSYQRHLTELKALLQRRLG
ncbi:dienelactone hydrolase family protein [Nocardioides sp. Iso805N]|uniref:dienelactone hydrolase family protein n=1 Tax=Nocardioides sp. Iso805N TaxID=1283287 RepID=UPI00036F96C7|nr:dienelactone hydrolase family protein [Nocardioides sp. Iso805N]